MDKLSLSCVTDLSFSGLVECNGKKISENASSRGYRMRCILSVSVA